MQKIKSNEFGYSTAFDLNALSLVSVTTDLERTAVIFILYCILKLKKFDPELLIDRFSKNCSEERLSDSPDLYILTNARTN
jgi:hypothetical protein